MITGPDGKLILVLQWMFFNMPTHQQMYPYREAETLSTNNHPSNHQPSAERIDTCAKSDKNRKLIC